MRGGNRARAARTRYPAKRGARSTARASSRAARAPRLHALLGTGTGALCRARASRAAIACAAATLASCTSPPGDRDPCEPVVAADLPDPSSPPLRASAHAIAGDGAHSLVAYEQNVRCGLEDESWYRDIEVDLFAIDRDGGVTAKSAAELGPGSSCGEGSLYRLADVASAESRDEALLVWDTADPGWVGHFGASRWRLADDRAGSFMEIPGEAPVSWQHGYRRAALAGEAIYATATRADPDAPGRVHVDIVRESASGQERGAARLVEDLSHEHQVAVHPQLRLLSPPPRHSGAAITALVEIDDPSQDSGLFEIPIGNDLELGEPVKLAERERGFVDAARFGGGYALLFCGGDGAPVAELTETGERLRAPEAACDPDARFLPLPRVYASGDRLWLHAPAREGGDGVFRLVPPGPPLACEFGRDPSIRAKGGALAVEWVDTPDRDSDSYQLMRVRYEADD